MKVGCTVMKARKIRVKGAESQSILVGKFHDNLFKHIVQLYLQEIEYKITATR